MLVCRRKINFARAFNFGLSNTSHWLWLACQTLLLTVASAGNFSISGEASAQSVTNYFTLQIKLQDKAAEPSRVRDAAVKPWARSLSARGLPRPMTLKARMWLSSRKLVSPRP